MATGMRGLGQAISPLGTVQISASTLTSLMSQYRRIVGLSVTSLSHEVVSMGPPYSCPFVLSTGRMLTPEQLLQLMQDQRAGALVLGGSALFRADGTTHFGVRKLISGVMGVSYSEGTWLPRKDTQEHVITPILLCREGIDDAGVMLTQYIKRNAGYALPRQARQQSFTSIY